VPGTGPHPDLLARLGEAAGSARRREKVRPDLATPLLREATRPRSPASTEAGSSPADIAITAGCNLAFFATMMLVAKAGDAVLLPAPWYFNHQMSLEMLGIEPRPLPCRGEAGFVPQVSDAEALIDDRVRALVLVTPNNPTGAVYPAHVIEEFAELCRRRGIFLVIDETYRDFLPADLNRAHGLFADESWRQNVIQLYSFSKSYSIPGHRTGAVTADSKHLTPLAKILDCIQICAPRTAQPALPWAIEGLRDWREQNRADINQRAAVFRQTLAVFPEWRIESIGAYFAYLRHPFPGRTGHDVAERLAAERGILCLPGSYFGPGQEDYLRVAFANVGPEILAAVQVRLADFHA
jgi:aspartate/methionine/tyrosine aminotransferase